MHFYIIEESRIGHVVILYGRIIKLQGTLLDKSKQGILMVEVRGGGGRGRVSRNGLFLLYRKLVWRAVVMQFRVYSYQLVGLSVNFTSKTVC